MGKPLAGLEGKVALITGTGGGQGRAAALLFAEAGCQVVGCDLKEGGAAETVEMVRAAGGEMISFVPVDLSNDREATGWVDDAAEAYGGVDILYNNASTAWIGPFEEMTFEDWRSSIANELDIVFLTTTAAWRHLIVRGGGVVINIGSISGMRGGADARRHSPRPVRRARGDRRGRAVPRLRRSLVHQRREHRR